MLKEILRDLSPTMRKVEQIIVRAEINTPKIGQGGVAFLYDHYIDALKKSKKNASVIKILNRIKKRIAGGAKRHSAYKGFLPDDVLTFLDIGDKKNVDPSKIFERYAPVKKKADAISNSIKRKMRIPLIVYIFGVLGVYKLITVFRGIRDDGAIPFHGMSATFLDHYVLITVAYGIVFAFLFLAIPEKLPFIKKVYNRIRAIFILASVEVYNLVGVSASEIADEVAKQYKFRRRGGHDTSALIRLLTEEKVIDDLQGAELGIHAGRGEMQAAISEILDDELREVDMMSEAINSAIGSLSLLLLLLPLGIAVYMIMTMMLGASDLLYK